MKKLMIVAAAAFGMAAFGDIESSNIVGYVNGQKTVDQFNFLASGFNTVGCNTFDIQQISIVGEEGTVGWGEEIFSIWAGGPEVVDGSEFIYWDPSIDPEEKATTYYWGDDQGVKQNYSIAAGQSVVVQCGANLGVVSSGEVPNGDVELTTVDQFNFIGNPFPMELDIQKLTIEADSVGWGEEIFSIWAGGPEVVEGSEFIYWDASIDPTETAVGCYWGDDEGNIAEFTIPVGQGIVIQCGEGLNVKIVSPFATK